MPVPWIEKFDALDWRPPKIEEAALRGMTLSELQQLREFVKRLCKCNLLKGSLRSGERERYLKWTMASQYHIVALVIKKLIPKHESFSWAELAAATSERGGKVARFFVSHWFGETFHDFMCSLEHHAQQNRVALDDTYWFCVCANDQHNVQLGSTLHDSPFYHALVRTEHTLLMLDRDGEVRRRLWCVYEWAETLAQRNKIQVGTSVGMVGSPLVSSGPFVDLLKTVRSADAVASVEADRQKIRRHIQAEWSGFERLDERIHEETLLRVESEHPLANERSHSGAGHDDAPGGLSRCDPWLRSLTLAQLRTAVSTFRQLCEKGGAEEHEQTLMFGSPEGKFEKGMMAQLLQDHGKWCSYHELTEASPAQPHFYLGFRWWISLGSLARSIEWLAEARRLPDTATFWVFPFSLDLYAPITPDTPSGEADMEEVWQRSFKGAHSFAYVVDCAEEVNRAAPMLDMLGALHLRKCTDIVTETGVISLSSPFANGSWEYGAFPPSLATHFVRIRVQDARCSQDQWGRRWKAKLDALLPEGSSERARFEHRIRSKAAGPALLDAAMSGRVTTARAVAASDVGQAVSLEEMEELCPGLAGLLSSQLLRGSLGETALHVAASMGQLRAMEWLLDHRADPNAVDQDGEAPLHHAAFAAQPGAARLLLAHGASPHLESYSMETALDVALQRPARFRRGAGDYDGVLALLNLGDGSSAPARPVKRKRSVCCAVG